MSAHRVGQGPWKVVVVGQGQPFVAAALDRFRALPEMVPATISLWFVPAFEAGAVDPYRNADTHFDGCAGNEWTPDPDDAPAGSGGIAPFSDPASRALRDFTEDAWLVLFYRSAQATTGPVLVSPDSCRLHAPSNRLAGVLAATSRYAVAPDFGLTGNWVDYLAGEGVAAASVGLPPERDGVADLAGLKAVLDELLAILEPAPVDQGVSTRWLDATSAGIWRYEAQTLVHPLALARLGDTLYLLDSGRVLAQEIAGPGTLQVVLEGGDAVSGTLVLEPLDLATDGNALLVLDRGGDVYHFEPQTGHWAVERAARGIGDSSSHYYVALAQEATHHFLAETSYNTITSYTADGTESAWLIPPARHIDLAASGDAVYLLLSTDDIPGGDLVRFEREGDEVTTDNAFHPGIALRQPRQVTFTPTAVYVLDWAGKRVVALDTATGALREIWQRTDRASFSAMTLDPVTGKLLLAGKDEVWFLDRPEMAASVPPGGAVPLRLHDEAFLRSLGSWLVPIGGTGLPERDVQLPGAPRHYRLGIHEGTDFYWAPGTEVRAVADGQVIRALVDYVPPTPAQLAAWYAESVALGTTPEEALDGYRGQQVWLEHSGGVITRYAHLRWIAPGIVDGALVNRGQLIGEVGNSGSPASLDSATDDAHLHLEIWWEGQFLGQFLRPIEVREWLDRLFDSH